MKILRSTWLDSRAGHTVCLVLVKYDDGSYDARVRLVGDHLDPGYAKRLTAEVGSSFPLHAALVVFHLQDHPLPFDPAFEDELEAADRLTNAI